MSWLTFISFLLSIFVIILAVKIAQRQSQDFKQLKERLEDIKKLSEKTDEEKIRARPKLRSNTVLVTVSPPKDLVEKIKVKIIGLYWRLIYFPDEVPKVIIKPKK